MVETPPRGERKGAVNCYPILYQWTSEDGLTHHGNSVGEGKSQQDAERRFFRQHPHVRPMFDEPKKKQNEV